MDAAWLGAAVLAAGFAWFRPREVARWPVALTIAALAVVATSAAATVGPQEAWLSLGSSDSATTTAVRYFNPSHNYGELTGTRDGTTLFRVRAGEPAYLRAEVLSRFDGHRWSASWHPEPVMAQPRARRESIEVSVRALVTSFAVSPGTVVTIDGATSTGPGSGDAYRFDSPPARGATYRVEADVTRPTPYQLAEAPPPDNPALASYRTVESAGRSLEIPPLGSPISPDTETALNNSGYAQPLELARVLSRDAVNSARCHQEHRRLPQAELPIRDRCPRRRPSTRGLPLHAANRILPALLRCRSIAAASGRCPGAGRHRIRPRCLRLGDRRLARSATSTRIHGSRSTSRASAGSRWIRRRALRPQLYRPPRNRYGMNRRLSRRLRLTTPVAESRSSPASTILALSTWGVTHPRRRRRVDADAETTSVLRILAGRDTPLPLGATYVELRRALEVSSGPETARLATVLETRQFSSSAVAVPQVRLRAIRRALRRDRGLIRGSFLAARAIRRGRREDELRPS